MKSLADIEPKEALSADWHAQYEIERDAIWRVLIRLNASILVLDKIIAFPFDIFGPYKERPHFWDLVVENFFETTALAIWKLTADNDSQAFTLNKFKNKVMEHLNPPYQQLVRKALRGIGGEERVKDVAQRVHALRNNVLAHQSRDWVVNPSAEAIEARKVYVRELSEYAKELNAVFDCLCLGHEYAVLPIDYHLAVYASGASRLMDIERLLLHVAEESPVLRMPERDPARWEHRRAELSESQIESINYYRKQAGLPEA